MSKYQSKASVYTVAVSLGVLPILPQVMLVLAGRQQWKAIPLWLWIMFLLCMWFQLWIAEKKLELIQKRKNRDALLNVDRNVEHWDN